MLQGISDIVGIDKLLHQGEIIWERDGAVQTGETFAVFNGVSQHIVCPTPDMDFSEFTVDFVFNPDQIKSEGRIFNTIVNKNGGFDGQALGFASSKKLEIWGQTQTWSTASNRVFSGNEKRHISLNYLPDALDVYVDGQFDITLNIQLAHLGDSYNIGGVFLNQYGAYFAGMIRDFRIWDRKLSAAETAFNTYKSFNEPIENLRANYPLKNNTLDYAGDNLHGTTPNGLSYITITP